MILWRVNDFQKIRPYLSQYFIFSHNFVLINLEKALIGCVFHKEGFENRPTDLIVIIEYLTVVDGAAISVVCLVENDGIWEGVNSVYIWNVKYREVEDDFLREYRGKVVEKRLKGDLDFILVYNSSLICLVQGNQDVWKVHLKKV